MTLSVYHTGSWQSGAPYVYHGGSWQVALSVSAYHSGSWQTVAQILSAVSITGTTAVSNGSNVSLGTSVTGGYGTLTYLWAKNSGAGTISGSATNSTVLITPTATNAEGEYMVTVTDSLTGGTTDNVVVVTWGTPP